MSAFVVDKKHIDVMVRAALCDPNLRFHYYHNGESHEVNHNNADEIGAMLWNENVRSVSHRYPTDSLESLPGRIDSPWLTPYVYDLWRTPNASPVAILKAIQCYEYQSCETPDWEETAAFAFCKTLTHRTIARLPGYDEAPWEWQEHSEATG